MSRIHEALKKAEQERALGLPQGGGAEAVPGVVEGAAAVMTAPAGVATGLEDGATLLSFQSLAARCAQAHWKPDPKRMLFFNPQNHARGSEEFRTLRSRLYQIRQKQRLQNVLVSSALPAEGKTFVAANLAQVIVRQHGRRALLIDADLRWSQLHLALGASQTPGLTDYLRGDADEYAVIQRGPLENLFFIPGGKEVQNPAELIANGRLKTLLHRVSAAFDWVIVDSPPVVPVSDASLLADMCDGVLLVLESAVTPLEMAQRARQEFANKTLLGVVLNRVAPRASYGSYYYDHYGSDGNKRKKKDKR